MRCECCQSVIEVGSQYFMLHGRPWITAHAIAYKEKRSALAAAANQN